MAQLSYVSQPRSSPYIYETVIDVFRRNVASYPDEEILIHRGLDGSRESLTNKQLDDEATKLAKFLVLKGIRKGDKVALFGPNTLQWVIGELAIIIAGGVVVHVTLSVTGARDLWDIFNNAGCKAFLIDPGKGDAYLDSIFQLLALFRRRRPSRDYRDVGSPDSTVLFLRKVENIPSCQDLPGILDMEECHAELPELFPEDQILIFTTSGSTGKPKMVSHAHFDGMNIEMYPSTSTEERSDKAKTYNDRPFGWAGGSPVMYICRGDIRVFSDSSIAIKGKRTMEIWNIIKEEGCSKALLMPYFLGDLISIKNEYTDSFKLDVILTGGQIVDNYYTQVIDVFTKALVVGYGSTEAWFICIRSPLQTGDQLEIGDVGKPIGGVEVKVIDENENVVKRCQPGEICIRSRLNFNGYYQNQDLNKEVFLEGKWFRSGDIGFITKDDRVIIQGRVKDIISRGTRKIIPDAVEDVVIQMNGLSHVAVVPVPDKRLYEEVCLCFITENGFDITEEDVKKFCYENFIVDKSADGLGERPSYFLKFDNFPLLSTGKPNKRKIRAEAINRLNIEK